MGRRGSSVIKILCVVAAVTSCGSTPERSAEPANSVVAAPVAADEPSMVGASEVSEMLTGNTVVGRWYGTPYRQFFDPAGATLYVERDDRLSSGEWRINATTGAYESKWSEFGAWESYVILRTDSTLYWQDVDGELLPFEVVEGRQIPDD